MNTTETAKTDQIERVMELHQRASLQWTAVEQKRSAYLTSDDDSPTWLQVLAAIDVAKEYDRDLRDFLAVNL